MDYGWVRPEGAPTGYQMQEGESVEFWDAYPRYHLLNNIKQDPEGARLRRTMG